MLHSRVWSAALALPLVCGLVGIGGAFAQQSKPAAPAKPPVRSPAPASPAPPAAPAPLSGPQSLTVMVVDVQALLQESKAAKMVRAQVEGKRAEYTKEISHEEEALRAERDALQRQQSSLSADALNRKGREFQQKVNELDRSVQAKRQALEKSNTDALSKIQQEMVKIIADIAKQRKANLVLQRTDLVLFDRAFDVTDEVMQKLDEQMPVMTVNFVNPQPPPLIGGAPPPATPTAKSKRR
jgi:Skp family chaperone for outer membrane proteins